MLRIISCAIFCVAAGPAASQDNGVSLSHGNAVAALGFGASSESFSGHLTIFRADTASSSQTFQLTWFYRVAGDTRERPFGQYAKSDGGSLTASTISAGNTGTLSYTETLGAATRFTAVWGLVLTDSAVPGSATLAQNVAVTNPGATPLTLALYHYEDLNVGGSFAGNKAT